MTQPNPFVEPRFPNIPPFSLMPGDRSTAPDELGGDPIGKESEISVPFPDPPEDPDTGSKTGGGSMSMESEISVPFPDPPEDPDPGSKTGGGS